MKPVLLISLFIFCASILSAQTATPPAGDGTSGNPYQIATLDNLYWVTQNTGSWGSYIIQTADIDADSTSGWDSGSGFYPIGNSTTAFTGSYNGQGHTITHLFINRSGQYNGLFGWIGGGSVRNLHLESVQVTGGDLCTGGMIGYLYYSATATNCTSTGTVAGTFDVGGLIGGLDAFSVTSNCYSGGSVTGANGGIGGLIGTASRNSVIKNCYSTSSVAGANSAFNIGGLIGGANTVYDTNCYSNGHVTGTGTTTKVGGLIGMQLYVTTIDCFWDTLTSGLDTSAAGTGKSSAEMKQQSTFTNAGWDFSTIWSISPLINNGYPYLEAHPPTAVREYAAAEPASLALLQNYPDPFNPATAIQFTVGKDARTIVRVFDILGRDVATLYDGFARTGTTYSVTFDGSRCPSGVYLYSIENGNQRLVRKMVMLK